MQHAPRNENRWRFGDTLESFARAHGIAPDALIKMNPGVDFSAILPGTLLRAAVPAKVCPDGALYTVREGDSFASIARAFSIQAGALAEQNPYVDPTTLHIGEVLCVPDRQKEATRARVAFGQTFSDILAIHGLTVEAFRDANPLINTDRLMPGQVYYL